MKQLGVVFSHSDYVMKSHGTERCIREIGNEMKKHDAEFIQFFPIRNKKLLSVGMNMVGANYNGEFLGIYRIQDVPLVYHDICRKNDYEEGIVQIHHLQFFPDLNLLAGIINEIARPVVMFVHDYFTLCCIPTLIDSNNQFCGTDLPSDSKCRDCLYKNEGKQHQEKIASFIKNIENRLKYIIVPSDYVKGAWSRAYPQWAQLVVVRPHVECIGTENITPLKEKIRISYVGVQNDFKGFSAFKKLADRLNDNTKYELHYFGTGDIKLPGVENHYVSIAEQGDDAMKTALKQSRIDICLFWANWPETYSYVFYELLCSGIFVVTNEISGNVTDMVRKLHNGVVLGSIEEMLSLFDDWESLTEMLNSYKNESSRPVNTIPNRDIDLLLCTDHKKCNAKGNAYKWKILTWVYLKKVRPGL